MRLPSIVKVARTLGRHPLGRRHPVRTAWKFLSWQLRARLSPGPHEVAFVDGTKLWARRGETGVTTNIYAGLDEFADMAFVAHALRPDDLFLDIGANAGSYTVLAAGSAGARVIAVEPLPATVGRLEENVRLNGLEARVRVVPCVVSSEPGRRRITSGHDTKNRVVQDEAGPGNGPGTVEVEATTVDRLLGGACPFIVKLDVEGHEAAVLAGAEAMLASPGPAAILVEISRSAGDAVLQILTESGFVVRSYDPLMRRLAPADPSVGTGNTLFVRAEVEPVIEARVREARPIMVQGEAI